jgi:hypothetical protein
MTDPRTPRTSDWHQGSTHSDQCVSIGGGPGHHDCVCFCHHNLTEPGTEAGKALLRYGRAMYATKWAETDYTNLVLAIEAEASGAARGSSERLAAALYAAGTTLIATLRGHPGVRIDGDALDAWEQAAERYRADPALSDPDAERQRAIGGLLRFTTHIRSCGWNSHKPCDCGLNQALGLTPTQDWRDDEALAADPALSDPDAERQRAIEQERARLRREYDDRMEMIGAASPPADVSPWDILRWVRDELLVDDPSAALPAAQETP